MEPQWRKRLEAIVDAPVLASVEAALANDDDDDVPQLSIFDDGENENHSKQELADMIQNHSVCGLTVDDIPQRFCSPLWFKILKAGPLDIPLVGGASTSGHGDVVWAAAQFCAEALSSGHLSSLLPHSIQSQRLEGDEAIDMSALNGYRVLELGAGVGLPSAVAFRLGAEVISSDVPDPERLLALSSTLALNSQINGSTSRGSARVVPHRWGESCADVCRDGKADLILCCDCLYVTSLHAPLLTSLASCLAPSGTALVSFSLHDTAPDEEIFNFFDKAQQMGFVVTVFGERQMPSRCANLAEKRSFVYSRCLRWATVHDVA